MHIYPIYVCYVGSENRGVMGGSGYLSDDALLFCSVHESGWVSRFTSAFDIRPSCPHLIVVRALLLFKHLLSSAIKTSMQGPFAK